MESENAWYLGYHVQSSHLLCLYTSPVPENVLLVAPIKTSSFFFCQVAATLSESWGTPTQIMKQDYLKWTGKHTKSHTGEAVPAVLRPVMQSAVLLEFWGAHHLFLAGLMQTLGKGSFVSKHLSFTNRESTVTSPMKAVKKMQSIKWNWLTAGTQLQSVHTTRCWLHRQSTTAFTVITTPNLNNFGNVCL